MFYLCKYQSDLSINKKVIEILDKFNNLTSTVKAAAAVTLRLQQFLYFYLSKISCAKNDHCMRTSTEDVREQVWFNKYKFKALPAKRDLKTAKEHDLFCNKTKTGTYHRFINFIRISNI